LNVWRRESSDQTWRLPAKYYLVLYVLTVIRCLC